MKHGGMPRYALKCKLVSHRVGVDGTSGPSLLGCSLDASTQRVRARGNTCPRCAQSLSLSLSHLVAFSRLRIAAILCTTAQKRRPHLRDTATVGRGGSCRYALKCRFSPSSLHRAFLFVSNPHELHEDHAFDHWSVVKWNREFRDGKEFFRRKNCAIL